LSRRVRIAACLLALLGGAVPAVAHTAVGVTGPAPEPGPATRIFTVADTVTVIGERPGTDALDAPVATTVVPAASWRESRTVGLDAPLAGVPGIIAQNRGGSNDVRITSRGFGARGAGERSNAGTTRGIRITLDGFPLTEPDGRTSLDLADAALLERIRVVRSNSSVLFGPASGGLIELQSATGFDDGYGEARAEFGSHGYAKQIIETGFVSGAARIRVAGSTGSFDGFRAHGEGSQSTMFATILSDPSPDTRLGLYLAGTHNLQRQAGALTREEFEADATQADPDYVAQDSRRDNRLGRLGARLEHDFDSGRRLEVGLFVEPKVLHRSERGRYRDFNRVHTGGSALLSGPAADGRVRWTVGVDEALQDGSVLFYDLDEGSRGTTLVADQREGINTFGAFGEAAWTPSTRWQVTAGGRWDNVHYVSEDHQDPALNASRSIDHVSPRVALSYRPAERSLFFAAVSGGIETPAFNEIDPPPPYDTETSLNPLLEPSHSLTVEVGTRGERFSGGFLRRLGYDVALYTLDVHDDIVPWDGGAWYRTAGLSRRRGFELGLNADLEHGLSARLTGTFTDNRYVDYETGAPDDEGNLVTVRYDGNETAGIPSTSVQGGLRWTSPAGLFLEFSAQHVGGYWANDANTDRVDAYTILDATAGLNARLLGCEALVFASVRNLSDGLYVASVYINGADGRYLEPGMRRNVLAGLSLRAW
jgi:iron complex outermembrane receptor protein